MICFVDLGGKQRLLQHHSKPEEELRQVGPLLLDEALGTTLQSWRNHRTQVAQCHCETVGFYWAAYCAFQRCRRIPSCDGQTAALPLWFSVRLPSLTISETPP